MFNSSKNTSNTFSYDLAKRGQYVTTSNELNKEENRDIFVRGNIKKDELDKKLEELSYQSGIQMSGSIARTKILENSKSKQEGTTPKMVDTVVTEYVRETQIKEQEKQDNPIYVSPSYERYSQNVTNRGKEILNKIKTEQPNTTIVRLKKNDRN